MNLGDEGRRGMGDEDGGRRAGMKKSNARKTRCGLSTPLVQLFVAWATALLRGRLGRLYSVYYVVEGACKTGMPASTRTCEYSVYLTEDAERKRARRGERRRATTRRATAARTADGVKRLVCTSYVVFTFVSLSRGPTIKGQQPAVVICMAVRTQHRGSFWVVCSPRCSVCCLAVVAVVVISCGFRTRRCSALSQKTQARLRLCRTVPATCSHNDNTPNKLSHVMSPSAPGLLFPAL